MWKASAGHAVSITQDDGGADDWETDPDFVVRVTSPPWLYFSRKGLSSAVPLGRVKSADRFFFFSERCERERAEMGGENRAGLWAPGTHQVRDFLPVGVKMAP